MSDKSTCGYDTKFYFHKVSDPVQWVVRGACKGDVDALGCGFVSDKKPTEATTYVGSPVTEFMIMAEIHIEHLLYSRNRKDE